MNQIIKKVELLIVQLFLFNYVTTYDPPSFKVDFSFFYYDFLK
jgi:hypothetical protein